MQTLKPRAYQEEAIDKIHAAWSEGIRRPAVVLPTGMGKTVIFAELTARAVATAQRVLILVHRDELVRQTVAKLALALRGGTIGVVKAERNEWDDRDVVVASVQTLGRERRLSDIPAGTFDIVIVDECHHAAANSYTNVLRYFGCFNDPETDGTRWHAYAVGFTATLTRADSRKLSEIWQKVVYKKDVTFGIAGGYLTDVRGVRVQVDGLDLDTIARRSGDYVEGQLGEAMIATGAGQRIAEAYLEHAARPCSENNADCTWADHGLRPGILFAPSVASAELFADDLNDTGIRTAAITGATPTEERQLIFKRYRAGELDMISSCMVLTEGFDMPEAEVAVIARPTSNAALYVQMVGRVLRPAPWNGKQEALVLDVVGVTGRHPLATLADLSPSVKPQPGESLTEAAVRQAAESEVAEALIKETFGQQMTAEIVDLFHKSKSVWLTTHGGKWFIPTREYTYFLWPMADGQMRIGRYAGYSAKGGEWLDDPMPVEMAMSWAEQYAEQEGSSLADKKASWRANSRKPSDAQLALCERYGIETDGLNRGQVSDAISVHLVSKALDKPKRTPARPVERSF